MADLMRIRAVISGTQGTPGLSTVYALGAAAAPVAADALDMVNRVRAFWEGVKLHLPTLTTIQVQSQVDVIDPDNGALIGGFSPAAPALVTGSGGSALPFAAAALLVHQTGIVVDGRRLMGRTFISPLAATTNNAGQLGPSANAAFTTEALIMLTGTTGSVPAVWHRPRISPVSIGLAFPVIGYTTRTPFAVLRSRRD